MNKLLYILPFIMLVVSCQSIERISIDQMQPAEVYYPDGLRTVAIIDHPILNDTAEIKLDSTARAHGISWLKGNTGITAEALAKALAEANYFDEVVICDTVVPASKEGMTQNEVTRLVDGLNVDFLLTVDDVNMISQRKAIALPEWDCYQGVADVKVYSTIQAYIPQRSKPLFTVHSNDSIYWEQYGPTVQNVAMLLAPDSTIIKEASEFAGSMPLKYLVPHWVTTSRTLYVGSSASMRDAMVAVRENNWEQANKLWKSDYDKAKKDRAKMQLTYDMSVYNEVAGDIDEAIKLAEEAQQLAYKVDKVEKKKEANGGQLEITPGNAYEMTNYIRTSLYVDKLKERKRQLQNLQVQMQRFNDDF